MYHFHSVATKPHGAKRKTSWTEAQVAHALALVAAEKGNVSAAAKTLGMSRRTLGAWYRGDRRVPESEDAMDTRKNMVTEERTKLAAEWRAVTFNALSELKARSSNGTLHEKSLVLLAGMGTDKMIALSGGNRQEHDVNVRVSLADLYMRALPVGAGVIEERGEERVDRAGRDVIDGAFAITSPPVVPSTPTK